MIRTLGRAGVWALAFSSLASGFQDAQAPEAALESYKVYTEHPRLFLRPARLRLLQRERDRKSLRWEQFELLMNGNAPMPEPGFAAALFYRITGERDFGRKAVAWATGNSGTDARQLAVVFDWCQDLLSDSESKTLITRLAKTASAPSSNLEADRNRILAAIVLAGHADPVSTAGVQSFFGQRWNPLMRELHAGRDPFPRAQLFALYEIMHAVRDNLSADLRDQFPKYFKELPLEHLMAYYPASYPAAENEFRILATKGTGEPDLRLAALARAAELAMVAFDANAPETQVLQGWLMNDRFLMRGPFGIPYEMLWANPYQPGLSYYHVPLVFHDDRMGRLFVRSSWEDSATWVGFFDGQLQMFRDGHVTLLNPELSREPLDLEEAIVLFGKNAKRFQLPQKEINDAFVVGLEPKRTYQVEIDDQELREEVSDPGGILYFPGVKGGAGIRFR